MAVAVDDHLPSRLSSMRDSPPFYSGRGRAIIRRVDRRGGDSCRSFPPGPRGPCERERWLLHLFEQRRAVGVARISSR